MAFGALKSWSTTQIGPGSKWEWSTKNHSDTSCAVVSGKNQILILCIVTHLSYGVRMEEEIQRRTRSSRPRAEFVGDAVR